MLKCVELIDAVAYMKNTSCMDKGKGEDFSKKIMQFLHDKCVEWKEKEGTEYSIYCVPMKPLWEVYKL